VKGENVFPKNPKGQVGFLLRGRKKIPGALEERGKHVKSRGPAGKTKTRPNRKAPRRGGNGPGVWSRHPVHLGEKKKSSRERQGRGQEINSFSKGGLPPHMLHWARGPKRKKGKTTRGARKRNGNDRRKQDWGKPVTEKTPRAKREPDPLSKKQRNDGSVPVRVGGGRRKRSMR